MARVMPIVAPARGNCSADNKNQNVVDWYRKIEFVPSLALRPLQTVSVPKIWCLFAAEEKRMTMDVWLNAMDLWLP